MFRRRSNALVWARIHRIEIDEVRNVENDIGGVVFTRVNLLKISRERLFERELISCFKGLIIHFKVLDAWSEARSKELDVCLRDLQKLI